MILVMWWGALVHPFRTMRRISCRHPRETGTLIDTGMNKMFRCPDCGAISFSGGGAA